MQTITETLAKAPLVLTPNCEILDSIIKRTLDQGWTLNRSNRLGYSQYSYVNSSDDVTIVKLEVRDYADGYPAVSDYKYFIANLKRFLKQTEIPNGTSVLFINDLSDFFSAAGWEMPEMFVFWNAKKVKKLLKKYRFNYVIWNAPYRRFAHNLDAAPGQPGGKDTYIQWFKDYTVFNGHSQFAFMNVKEYLAGNTFSCEDLSK
jgi:hypothetical protein